MNYNLNGQIVNKMILNTFIIIIGLASIITAIGNELYYTINYELRIVVKQVMQVKDQYYGVYGDNKLPQDRIVKILNQLLMN